MVMFLMAMPARKQDPPSTNHSLIAEDGPVVDGVAMIDVTGVPLRIPVSYIAPLGINRLTPSRDGKIGSITIGVEWPGRGPVGARATHEHMAHEFVRRGRRGKSAGPPYVIWISELTFNSPIPEGRSEGRNDPRIAHDNRKKNMMALYPGGEVRVFDLDFLELATAPGIYEDRFSATLKYSEEFFTHFMLTAASFRGYEGQTLIDFLGIEERVARKDLFYRYKIFASGGVIPDLPIIIKQIDTLINNWRREN